MAVLIVLVILGLFGGVSGAVATSRGHGFWPFFLLGALISPLLAILLCFIIAPPKRAASRRRGRRPPQRGGRRPPYRAPQRDVPFNAPARDANPYAAPASRSFRR